MSTRQAQELLGEGASEEVVSAEASHVDDAEAGGEAATGVAEEVSSQSDAGEGGGDGGGEGVAEESP
jgi:hypothetical protein